MYLGRSYLFGVSRVFPVLILLGAALAFFAMPPGAADAIAPGNDNFAAATPLDEGSVNWEFTVDATIEFQEVVPICQGNFGKSVWYRHTAADADQLTVSTSGSAFDTVVAVYRAPDSTPAFSELIPVACDDDSGEGTTSLASFTPLAGATYFIQAGGFGSASGGLFTRLGRHPENDNVAQAIAISPPFSATFQNATATDETFELTPCGVSRAVWFKATLPAGSYVISSDGLVGDPSLGVYFGPANGATIGNITLWDCNDDMVTVNSQLNLVVDFATTWYFQVGGAGGSYDHYTFSLGVLPDADGDGIRDQDDNCLYTPNGPRETDLLGVGNQWDTDNDGVPGTQPPHGARWGGDACDIDDDEDDLADAFDGCPYIAEDLDGFEDGDGCDDVDNDLDGILDVVDSGLFVWKNPLGSATDCRNVAEDFDSFHDGDGCPEPDNDYDNFPDPTDDCPGTDFLAGPDGISDFGGDEPVLYLVPYQSREDFDGVLDNDGCHDSPEDDYDGDSRGVLDGGLPIFRDTREALSLGTDPARPCALTPTANDEPEPDAWPPDFNDSQSVSVTDVLAMKPVFGTSSARHDLNASGSVGVTDVLFLKPYFGSTCVP
jgi:hypothetical protein